MNISAYRQPRWIAAAAVVVALAAALLVGLDWRGSSDEARGAEGADAVGVSPFELLAASVDEDFPQPPSPWPFDFPADHAAHDEFRTEWWYLSGTLRGGSDSRRLGVQWLLMRVGLRGQQDGSTAAAAEPPEHDPADDSADDPAHNPSPTSAWRTSQIYAGLFSISAPTGPGLRTDGKLSRGAVALAGAEAPPVRVWIENWQLAERAEGDDPAGWALHLDADDVALDLALRAAKPPVTAGDLAGPGGTQAVPFQFYTQPRLEAQGTLVADGQRITVDGVLSFEHAWGELPLPGGPVGNDRFSLHLDDGSELILLHTHRRRAGGTSTASTTGLLIDPRGAAVPLAGDDVSLEPTAHWSSPRTGTRYPTQWRLRLPSRSIDLTLTSPEADQEGEAWLSFWAGPVQVEGTATGAGFVQLYGYGES